VAVTRHLIMLPLLHLCTGRRPVCTFAHRVGTQGRPCPQKLKLELTWKTAETMAKAMKATNEKATMSTEAEIVCESVPSQRSSSAR